MREEKEQEEAREYLWPCELCHGGKEGARRRLREGPSKCYILLNIKYRIRDTRRENGDGERKRGGGTCGSASSATVAKRARARLL